MLPEVTPQSMRQLALNTLVRAVLRETCATPCVRAHLPTCAICQKALARKVLARWREINSQTVAPKTRTKMGVSVNSRLSDLSE